jgi:exodeoxyribonuclease VII small subunit
MRNEDVAMHQTIKQKIIEMLGRLPDDIDYDRAIYHIGAYQAIEVGLKQAESGDVTDHEEFMAELLAEETASESDTFEKSLSALESIVHNLEDGELGLAEALARYEDGVKHLKHCYQRLEEAERKIELLTGVAENGSPCTEPFEESSESLAETAGRRRRGKQAPSASNGEATDRDIDA